ncbi:immunity 26/phosphotriesterase HocA family protein [Paenibacillus chitinolyticus]|uniref:immunity 26/phosphotriesterase HocA family protein n=1 Tax=Paenibacillus chitinolyticus TaxID=79263 RepID=UPI0036DB5F49
MTEEFTELRVLKRTRKNPQDGDIFVMEPKENLFYFGKVINDSVESKNPFFKGWYLVYLYNTPSDTKEIPDNLDPNNLLIPPMVINKQGWLKGYFETIGSEIVTDEEKSIDFGFWDMTREKFYSLSGEVLKKKPEIFTGYGLISYGGIGRGIHRLLSGKPHNL